MASITVAKEFDEISPVYDATRSPLDSPTMEALARTLRDRGIRSILEIGVGTGRIAGPLGALGFDVTGVDASRGMLGVARSKGLSRLVRGSAYRLPFATESFDVTLFAHVLHLLDDPPSALHEGNRVGRQGALALVHPRPPGATTNGDAMDSGRRVVFRALAREGVPLPSGRGGPRTRERVLLDLLPPLSLTVLSDQEVTVPLTRTLEMFERRASRQALHVPPEVLERAVAAARAELGDRTETYRRVEALAAWNSRVRDRRKR